MKKLLLSCMMILIVVISYAQTTVTIGAGTSTSGTNDNGNPIYRSANTSAFHHSKSIQLLTATDLATASIPGGATVSSIAYNKTTDFNVSGTNKWTLNVYLKNSAATALVSGTAWDTMIAGATLFYTETIDSTNNFPATAGWVTWSNTTGNMFNYSGGAIEVYIEWVPGGTMVSPFTGGAFLWAYDGVTTGSQAMGTSNSTPVLGTQSSFSVLARRYQTQLTYTATACTGTPTPGNTVSSAGPVCAGAYTSILSAQNQTTGSGVTYQWYKNGTAILGATNSTYIATITAADSYYVAVTCSGVTTNSTAITVAAPIGGITTFPWTENFDAMTTIGSAVLPSCWTNVTGSKAWSSANAGTTTYNAPKSAPNYVNLAYSNSIASQLWTPAFELVAGTSYDFSFFFNTNGTSSSYTGWDGNVLVNSTPSLTGATDLGTFITASQGNTGYASDPSGISNPNKNTFVPTTSGSYVFGISVTSTSSPWYLGVDDFKLEVTPTCASPTNVTVANITTATADINWTAPVVAPASGYEIYYTTSPTVPTLATAALVTGITGTTSPISSLSPSSTYYAYVRSNCGAEKSQWSSVAKFTTACVPVATLPWTENFDSMSTIGDAILPVCWITTGGIANEPHTTQNAASQTYNDPRSAPNYVSIYYPTTEAYLWTPGFTLTAGQSYDFTFYWVGDGYSGWEGDVLVNSSQSETGATQVGSSFISGATITASTYTKSKSIFIPTTTGTYYFGVKSFASSFDPYYMGFDDFSLEISPTCSEPTALSSSNLTTTSADVSWTAPAIVPAFGYEVYYNTTNVAPTAATVATVSNITTTNTTLTPLNSSSTYYFWVRSVCSATEKSSWSNVGTFNTACATVNIPYTQDFSSAIVPALPNCTSAVNNGTGNIWETSNSGINGNSLRYGYSFTDPADTWFFTPGMSMTAGNTYYIGYNYAGTSYDESMKVAIGTTPDAASMTTVINDYPSITGNAVNNVVDQMFTPTVSGVYYLGFQAYSAADQNALYVDDITVTATPLSTSEISVKENLLTVAPNPFKDIIRISDVKDVVSISIVDLSGRLVKTVKPAREINLGDLKTGMYLINLKMKDGSVQTVKAIKK